MEKPSQSRKRMRNAENIKKKLKPMSKKQSTEKVKPTIAKQSLKNEAKPTIAKHSLKNEAKPTIAMNAFVEHVKKKLKLVSKKQTNKKVKPTIAKQSNKNKVKPTIAIQSLEKEGKPTITKQSLEEDVKPTSQNPEKKESDNIPGTVYLGHIPHGFYELELRKFFSQFGKITCLRLCRSSRTGGSKGYAFIQFQFEAVAKVVAESMNNYLFFKKILKCHFIPSDELYPDIFKGWKKGTPLKSDINRMKHNKQRTAGEIKKLANRRVKRLKQLKAKLVAQGITAFKVKSFDKKREEIMEKL